MIKNVMLFPNTVGRVTDAEISGVEQKLNELGITSKRKDDAVSGEAFDAIIALGGDGTMLRAAHTAFEAGIPLLGINFGTLGYMSGLESGEIDMLDALKSPIETEERMLLEIRVIRSGDVISEYTALNEAVIIRRPQAGIANLELLCDGSVVCGYRADGVIVATPTGSSAYVMSAGGPIIDTKLDAFCVCPICPHAFGSRALVFSPNSELSVINKSENSENSLTADGHLLTELDCGDVVAVRRSKKTLKLLKIKKDAFYDVLYRKMT